MTYIGAFLPLIVIICVAAIAAYGRYRFSRWHERPSDMPEMLTASFSYQTLEYMESHSVRQGIDPEKCEIDVDDITSYMTNRGLEWRQRNDIIRYMLKMGWIYATTIERDNAHLKVCVISKTGKRELKTADGLRVAVNEAAEALRDEGINADQAKVVAGSVTAAALRVEARTGPSESRERAEALADEIEKAVKARDSSKIDRAIGRTRDVLQIITYSLPFVREILRILGPM